MNEISETFDYSIVDDRTASFLKAKEQEMRAIVLNGAVQLGDKLIEAQEKLAKYNNGTFEKWFKSLGLKKTTAYNYINQAQFVHQMNESEQINIFQELPMTLRTEVSKPSAQPEAVELVLSGDIRTTKEYRELEKKLKKKDEQINNLSDVINDMSEKEPEVVEKEIVIEKIPDDYNYFKGNYEATKKNYEFFKEQNSQLRDEIKSLEDAIKRAPSHEEVNSLQEQLSAKQERELSINKIYEFQEAIEKFTHDHSSILYSNDLNRMETDRELLISFEDSINHLIEWAEEVKKELPNKNIIEGDVL